jgi:hypothetical protein
MGMPELEFAVQDAQMVPHAAAPLLAFQLRVSNRDPAETIHAVTLRCQVRIEVTRRRYAAAEAALLLDLFGERERWGETLRSLLWTFTSAVVPPFTGSAVVDVPVPCTYDFNVATAKYFHALQDGEVPVLLLFSGTVFYAAADGALRVAQIPWDREAPYRLPVRVWRAMMDHYYPNSAWLSLRQDVFDQLYRYKLERGLPTWELAMEELLQAGAAEVRA